MRCVSEGLWPQAYIKQLFSPVFISASLRQQQQFLMFSMLSSNAFAGVTNVLNITFLETDLVNVRNNLEGEQELMPDIVKEDAQPIPEEEEDAHAFHGGLEELRRIMQNASKGVTEDTDKQYCE